MAIIAGANVKFVTVANLSGYNDIASKDPGTIYFVREAKKIYVDGIAYGVNDSDLDIFLKLDGTSAMSGPLNMNGSSIILNTGQGNNNIFIKGSQDGQIKIGNDTMGDFIILKSNGIDFLGGSAKITGVGAPENDTEVTNKKYVDDVVQNEVVSKKGQVNGFAGLDDTGKVPSAQLPSYVDDVLEYATQSGFPSPGEEGKIYVAKDTNKTYRWSGSAYVEISASLALGETSSTAYRGDYGKTAYEHTSKKDNPHGTTKAHVGLGSVGNYAMATKSQAEDGDSTILYMNPARTKDAINYYANKTVWEVVS